MPSWIHVRHIQNHGMVSSLRVDLGPGEAEAIALCDELSAVRLILDDKKARRIARQLHLPVTGTLAILLHAQQRGLIANVTDVLDSLQARQFRVSDALIENLLRRAGE